MAILALDTATMVSSVAVAEEQRLLAEITTETRLTHSETLLPHIEEVLKLARTEKGNLTAVAVSIGPGSFTGLRIGLAAAKAICYSLNISLVTVPTLQVLAARFPVPLVKVCALLDAQKGNVYREIFTYEDGETKTYRELCVLPLDEAIKECAEEAKSAPVILTGEVAEKRRDRIILPPKVTIAPPAVVMPRAAEVAFLGLKKLSRGETENLMTAEPLYVRRSEAEELFEARQRKSAT